MILSTYTKNFFQQSIGLETWQEDITMVLKKRIQEKLWIQGKKRMRFDTVQEIIQIRSTPDRSWKEKQMTDTANGEYHATALK